MALDFPTSPTVGQQYGGYVFDGVKWKVSTTSTAPASVQPTPPTNPTVGDMWFNSTDGTMYFYYNDGNTSQWVESRAPIVANGYYSPNYIINGAFEINQRGFTSSTTPGYGFDRWVSGASGGTQTYSSQAFTPGAAPIAGYEAKNYARIVTSGQSAATDYSVFYQWVEDVRTLAGQTATISFWAKAGSGTPKVAVELLQSFGSGGSPSTSTFIYAGQVTLSTSWARYSVTVNVPSISGKTIGTTANTSALLVQLWTSAGSNYASRTGSLPIQSSTIDFWGVQVEDGAAATAFRRNANSIAGELAACQRYFNALSGGWGVIAFWNWDTAAYARFFFPEMRVAPSASLPSGNGTMIREANSAVTVTGTSITDFTKSGATWGVGTAGGNYAKVGIFSPPVVHLNADF